MNTRNYMCSNALTTFITEEYNVSLKGIAFQ